MQTQNQNNNHTPRSVYPSRQAIMGEILSSLLAPSTSMQDNVTIVSAVISLCRGVICLVGLLGNFFTIRTFLAMGLKDGVTLSFVFLAVCDFMLLLFEGAASMAYVFVCVEMGSNYKKNSCGPLQLCVFFDYLLQRVLSFRDVHNNISRRRSLS